MGTLWTVAQSTGNLASSGTGTFRGDIQTLEGQFLGDGGALDNVVYDINSESGSISLVGLGSISIFTTTGQVAISGTTAEGGLTTVSGFLQGQITQNASDISSNYTEFTNASGSLQGQLDSHTGDATIHFTEASIDHGSISGLGDDDHTQYTLADGTRAFTGTVAGVTPTADAHLATKGYVDTSDATISGHLQSQITSNSDHGNLSGLSDDDHTQYFLTAATAETTRIVAGNDLLFQSDGSRGTPGSTNTLTIDGAVGSIDMEGTLRVRDLVGLSRIDGSLIVGDLTVTGTQTIINTVTDVVNDLTVSGSAFIGDPDTPFEDKLTVRGDTDMSLDATRAADTVLELTHSGAAGSLDIAGVNNDFMWWSVDNRGNATFQDLTVTGTITGLDHGQLDGLADDDHVQYILVDGTRAFTGTVQATSSGTVDIGTQSVPFDEIFGTPVVREYSEVSASPRRGMIAIDENNQFVGYNGTDWIIIG